MEDGDEVDAMLHQTGGGCGSPLLQYTEKAREGRVGVKR